jgi:hypothetical protein
MVFSIIKCATCSIMSMLKYSEFLLESQEIKYIGGYFKIYEYPYFLLNSVSGEWNLYVM